MSSGAVAKWLKLAIFVLLVLGAAAVVHFGGVDLNYDSIQAEIDGLGLWAPAAYVAFYIVATLGTVPGTLLTVMGATLFPLGEAYALVLVGATAGAGASFAIGRVLGRDAIQHMLESSDTTIAETLRRWTERVERNGLLAILYLRMAYVPFPLLNYAAPLTGVRFRDFIMGTFFGIVPGAFVFVFMGNTVRTAWETGSVSGIPVGQSIAACALFIGSFSLPWIVKRVAGSPD